ncbi:MAG: alcohol dehydrogenase catalytic domain-containing protein [Fimbriimonas sp.]
MRVARYIGEGNVAIVEEPMPSCPPGGLLVQTEACGLCSGELMQWYMDQKIPHVLGHEVAGIVVESDSPSFPVGTRVFPHHHAPCLQCEDCRRGLYVHCPTWRKTKLVPGGMADFFAVAPENLTDTHVIDDLTPEDGALIEPLACVAKSIRMASPGGQSVAVIGLGVMGLLHMLVMPGAVGYDLSPRRIEWATNLGLQALHPDQMMPADVIIVCPGSQATLDLATRHVCPGGTIVLFAPQPPGERTILDANRLYFADVTLRNAYSCGPDDTAVALQWIRESKVRANQVVSDFIALDELPKAYHAMKRGDILKAMVRF